MPSLRFSRLRSVTFRAPPILPFAFGPQMPSLPKLPTLNLGWNMLPAAHASTEVAKLVVVNVKGDGRCLYRSIAKSLASEESRHLPAHLETEDADALRGIAWKHMCVDKAAEYARKNIVEGSLRNYCSQMRSPSFFAGEAEILAISEALKIPISIFLKNQGRLRSIATYGEKYKNKSRNKVIRVLYNGTNHYNAVLRR